MITAFKRMGDYGFLTCSSQPQAYAQNMHAMHTYQRAYVSGYMPSALWKWLYAKLPRDLIIWETDEKSAVIRAYDSLLPNASRWYSWSGEMGNFKVREEFLPLDVRPFHVIDMDWKRHESYVLDAVLNELKSYWHNM